MRVIIYKSDGTEQETKSSPNLRSAIALAKARLSHFVPILSKRMIAFVRDAEGTLVKTLRGRPVTSCVVYDAFPWQNCDNVYLEPGTGNPFKLAHYDTPGKVTLRDTEGAEIEVQASTFADSWKPA